MSFQKSFKISQSHNCSHKTLSTGYFGYKTKESALKYLPIKWIIMLLIRKSRFFQHKTYKYKLKKFLAKTLIWIENISINSWFVLIVVSTTSLEMESGSLEKWLILSLWQEMSKVSLRNLLAPKTKESVKDQRGCVKWTQKPIWINSYWQSEPTKISIRTMMAMDWNTSNMLKIH